MLALPTLHPAFLLRSAEGAQGQAKFSHVVQGDFAKALSLLKRRPDWDESVIWRQDAQGRFVSLFPTLQEVYEFCRRAQGKLIAVDVETSGKQPLNSQLICVGIAAESGDAICIPVLMQHGRPYWTRADFVEVWKCVRWLMLDEGTPKVFHNGSFDCLVLLAHGAPVRGWRDDTMQAHHVLDGELPQGLAYVGSRWLEVPHWKNLGGDTKSGDLRWLALPDLDLRSYNLRDCLVTLRALPKLLLEVKTHFLEPLYREEIQLCQEMMLATLRGLFVDQERRAALALKLTAQRDAAIFKLRELAGPTFNPASPGALGHMLFERLKFPVVKETKKGAPSTDKEAMILLALHARSAEQISFLQALVDWKGPAKLLSTFVEPLDPRSPDTILLGDGRLHVSWKLLTVSGRFASSPNAQNWPLAVKKIFRAGEGMKLVGVDLSQAEVRGISYLAHDTEILKFYEPDERGEDINLHTVNTVLNFGVRSPGEDTNDRTERYLEEQCPKVLKKPYAALPVLPKSAWKPARTLAKNFRFGWQYGAQPDTLHAVIRSKRDPETNAQLFPDITLGEIEAMKIRQELVDPAVPKWWNTISQETQARGFYSCPISGRIRWFRGGFKRTEMLNFPVQSLIGSHVNRAMPRIGMRLRAEAPGAMIVCQVHDMIGAEVPEAYALQVERIYTEELSRTFALPGFPRASLPPDKPKTSIYMNEV